MKLCLFSKDSSDHFLYARVVRELCRYRGDKKGAFEAFLIVRINISHFDQVLNTFKAIQEGGQDADYCSRAELTWMQ